MLICTVRTCTNPGCSWSGEWRSLAGHLAECEHQPVACKYAIYGCEEKRKRKEILEHEENTQFANGKEHTNGSGTHVSVEMCLMKGANDNYLTWPFIGTVTFELLNQLRDRGHHKGTFTFPQTHPASQRVTEDEMASVGFGIDQVYWEHRN